ncbi:hypothetical protein ABT160_39995 [Streptomyces sp. NPDC001941]|uniref:hypothetical protein n=1 Tax=Streptomyces sp. NPDC001941 TaxID=3154659 RepID=UPI00332D3D39
MRRAAAVVATTTMMVGGIALTASPASAAAIGKSGCTRNDADRTIIAPNLSWPAVHDGPAGSRKVVARVDSAGDFRVQCSTVNSAGNRWYYGYVDSGADSGKHGWVWSGNF